MGLRKKKPAVKLSEIEAESGVTVAVGDDIVIDSGSTMPFVAKIQNVLPATKKKEKGRLKVSWYYFPEDTTGGRQVFHSKCEIFKSNHEDIVSTQSVMNTCKVLQLPQWCTYHAEGDSKRQAPNGPHNNTRPFDKAEAAEAPTEAAATAKPPATSENGASASTKPQSDPTPPSPNAAPPDPPAKPDAANDARPAANGSTHRGKRKLADRPAAAPNSAARRVVAEPSPEPEPPASGSRGAKAASTKNGSAAGENAAKKKNEGKAAAEGDGEEGEGGSDDGAEREGSPMVFLCRHAYDAKRHKWVDEEVPLYCVCCMPYNPDLDMVECVRCGEWFHGECLGMNEEQFELACKQDEWTCIACSAKKSKVRTE